MVRERAITRYAAVWVSVTVAAMFAGALAYAQGAAAAAPYRLVENWAQVPAGDKFGAVSWVSVDSKGLVHAFRRAGNVWTFTPGGQFVRAWGEDIKAKQTHALRIDRDGFIWTTDSHGHQVKKFRADGTLAMTLGKYDVPGKSADLFNRPTDVVVTANGDFFVSDGYGNQRIAKFNKDGKFLKEWGSKGTGPGQFRLPHTIVQDSRGRLIVGDRCGSTTIGNSGCTDGRVLIFDTEGKFLEEWTHLGVPFCLAIGPNDTLYVGGSHGKIFVADARTGKVLETIEKTGNVHGMAVDAAGDIFASSAGGGGVRRYTRSKS
jgi:sugar lactone lactonase YvrE